jgi:hypothetical protein
MIDGYHPGEVLVSRIVEDLIRRAPAGSFLSTLDAAYLGTLRSGAGVTPLSFRAGQ